MPSFISNENELAQSVRRFMNSPEYWRDVIGNNPKYFVHIGSVGTPLWGLSKYCAFRNMKVVSYVTKYRNTAGGGTTQKHISKICNKNWTPLGKVPPQLRAQFESWFAQVTAGRLQTKNIHLLTIDGNLPQNPVARSKREISPEELQLRLEEQAKTGKIGEEIALQYETARLLNLGAKDPLDVEHVSLLNSAAGFDIRSSYKKEKRYIEVKASVSPRGEIYVTLNELITLQKHGGDGYIYFVHVSDKDAREGRVIKVVRNPFANGKATEWLSPILFQGALP